MEKKKRPLTLTACILTIIVTVIDIILSILTIDALTRLESQYSDYGVPVDLGTTKFIIVVAILLATALLILGIILLTKCSRPVEIFKKANGLIITVFVFESIIVFCPIF